MDSGHLDKRHEKFCDDADTRSRTAAGLDRREFMAAAGATAVVAAAGLAASEAEAAFSDRVAGHHPGRADAAHRHRGLRAGALLQEIRGDERRAPGDRPGREPRRFGPEVDYRRLRYVLDDRDQRLPRAGAPGGGDDRADPGGEDHQLGVRGHALYRPRPCRRRPHQRLAGRDGLLGREPLPRLGCCPRSTTWMRSASFLTSSPKPRRIG